MESVFTRKFNTHPEAYAALGVKDGADLMDVAHAYRKRMLDIAGTEGYKESAGSKSTRRSLKAMRMTNVRERADYRFDPDHYYGGSHDPTKGKATNWALVSDAFKHILEMKGELPDSCGKPLSLACTVRSSIHLTRLCFVLGVCLIRLTQLQRRSCRATTASTARPSLGERVGWAWRLSTRGQAI